MNKLKTLLYFILSISLAGCNGLGKMAKNYPQVKHEVTPNPLELHGDSVAVSIKGTYPPKYFAKKLSSAESIVSLLPDSVIFFPPTSNLIEDGWAVGLSAKPINTDPLDTGTEYPPNGLRVSAFLFCLNTTTLFLRFRIYPPISAPISISKTRSVVAYPPSPPPIYVAALRYRRL